MKNGDGGGDGKGGKEHDNRRDKHHGNSGSQNTGGIGNGDETDATAIT